MKNPPPTLSQAAGGAALSVGFGLWLGIAAAVICAGLLILAYGIAEEL